jgi:predicted HAD superfamily Cof-like phosphohydrolase
MKPRSAHANRIAWIKEKFPDLSKYVDMLWGTYGALGYEGIDGERAKKALEAMEVILNGLERETGIRFK